MFDATQIDDAVGDAFGTKVKAAPKPQAQPTTQPAPIRTNNPGALMPGGKMAQFPSMEEGLKALDQNLASYGKKGINTLSGVISTWAPSSENNTNAYIAHVAKVTGLDPNQIKTIFGSEAEDDPETGTLELVRYTAVHDVGVELNPLLVAGQVHGGIAQAAGQALMEQIVYDEASGQLLSGSFMDYAMPRAADFSRIAMDDNPVPTKTNPLGVKGCGEAGAIAAFPAIQDRKSVV